MHYHTRTKSCLNPNAGRDLLRSESRYSCNHGHEGSLRKNLFNSNLLDTLRTGNYVLSSLMENEISMIVSWGSTQELTAEHSSNNDSTLHEGVVSPSNLVDGEDVLMTDSAEYFQEVEHHQP